MIPPLTEMLSALERVQNDLVRAIYMKNPVQCATLDMDATLIATQKKEGLFSYKGGSRRGHAVQYVEESDDNGKQGI